MVEIVTVLIMIACACNLMGHILVLRNEAMIADALSHVVLLGIVLGFLLSRSLESPLLLIGATVLGVFTIFVIEQIQGPSVSSDAAVGIIFPFFFALAVICISLFARNTHLDIDLVLVGEIIFVPLHRMTIFQFNLPVSFVKMGIVLVLDFLFVCGTYNRLKVYLLDPMSAKGMGIATNQLQLIFITLVALTIVTSFEAIGAITVISFLVGPSMTALFFTKRYGTFLCLSSAIAIVVSIVSITIAQMSDSSVAAVTAVCLCVVFCFGFIYSTALKKVKKGVQSYSFKNS